jgi:ketosteroid isomerase-like protein
MRKSIASVSMVLALLACRSDKPEDQVRKTFGACVTAVKAGDAAAAAQPLDATFRGPEGMDKAAARLFLMGIFRQEKVGLTVVRNEVTVAGNEAFQEVDLLITGRSGGLLPQDASRRSFGLRWRKADGDWRILEIQER